ncbi:MAG: hemerythrin domain-containing protein [Acidobacteria bacterium]|nr:hemerythrin domain-containing protein [Acidobacteriota bacterium]
MTPEPLHRDPSLIPLSHQHQHGLALTVFIDRGLKAEPTREKGLELAAKVARAAEVELLGHFRVEEEILFPAVRRYLASGELLDRLIAEHRVMEDLVRRIAHATDEDRIPLLKRFGEVLHGHIRTEERQLFQDIQERLDASRLKELGRAVAARVEAVCPLSDRLPWAEK